MKNENDFKYLPCSIIVKTKELLSVKSSEEKFIELMDEKFKDVLDSFSDQRIKNILEDN